MSAQNCFQRTRPKEFGFSFEAPTSGSSCYYTKTAVNHGITDRELACTNLLATAYSRLQRANAPYFIAKSTIPRRTLPPPYPYPRTNQGVGYRYFENVEFGADDYEIVVRYLNNPIQRTLPWPSWEPWVPSLVILTGDVPSIIKYTDYTSLHNRKPILARLDETLTNDVIKRSITNFNSTTKGTGAIFYPGAANDPNPTNNKIPRLFSNKTDFESNFSWKGFYDRPCSGCDLCIADRFFIPESGINWSATVNGEGLTGTGYNPWAFVDPDWLSIFERANLNPRSKACAVNPFYISILCIDTTGGPSGDTGIIYYNPSPLKVGSNTLISPYPIEGYSANLTIELTYD